MKVIILNALFLIASLISHAQVAQKPEDISPLLIGEKLPDEKLTNSKNEQVQLYTMLQEKPTVLVFYRGGWCPYCNKQLFALAQAEEEILKAGYQIIAITPDSYENLEPTAATGKISYKLFSDPAGNLLQKVGIAFQTPEKAKEYISKKTKGKVSEILPVPTVMVVNTKGEILFEYINPNYSVRISKELLLAALNNVVK